VVSVVIISQLFLLDDTTLDTERFWQETDVIFTDEGDEREWTRRKAIESFSLICPNCTFTNQSSNGTATNDTMLTRESFYRYLRQYIRQLNHEQFIRNLDKFDLKADSDGSLIIVIQVLSFD